MYCGDETGSFIGDVGSHTSRFGYGGEDNPKYLAPSYMAETTTTSTTTTVNEEGEEKFFIPSSCYQGRLGSQNVRPILRMPWFSSSLQDEQRESSSSSSMMIEPQIDPNAYLQQGDIIQDWDALERIWQTSVDILRVSDTKKHTLGGMPFNKNISSNKKKRMQQPAAGGVESSTVGQSAAATADDSGGGNRCVHPILAVTPGLTHSIINNNTGTTTTTTTTSQYDAAIQRKQQTRMTEFLLETLEAPAIFLAPTPMLSSFCFGRQTSLIVDIGAGGCRVTPVVDGLCLKQAQRRNGRGGDYLGNVAWRALLEEKVVLRPRYQLRSGITALETKSPYFYRWAMQDLMYEIRTSPPHNVKVTEWCSNPTVPFLRRKAKAAAAAGTSSGDEDDNNDKNNNNNNKGNNSNAKEGGGNIDSMDVVDSNDDDDTDGEGNTIPAYELPDGTHIDMASKMGKDLCRIPELFFTDDVPYVKNNNKTTSSSAGILAQHPTLSNLPLHKLIFSSLSAVGDGDIRKELANNIILTGGSSLFPNLEQRLSMEIPRIVPSTYKCRVIASRNSVERSCSAWVGASILTSLGSFQQLWLSKTEYEEYGSSLSTQRFP